jgi:hypothetical protein
MRALGTDVCIWLRPAILSSWQAEWGNALGNKLRVVKPSGQDWQWLVRAVRRDEINLTRLQIGHTCLAHEHLRGQPAPVFTHCGVPLTVARILVDCRRYAEARRICHLEGVICDILGGNLWRASNILAFCSRACHSDLTDFFRICFNFSTLLCLLYIGSCNIHCQTASQRGKFRSDWNLYFIRHDFYTAFEIHLFYALCESA